MGKLKKFRPRRAYPAEAGHLCGRVDAALRRRSLESPDVLAAPPRTIAEAVADAMIRRALAGDVAAAKEIADRVEGPALCPRCGRAGEPA